MFNAHPAIRITARGAFGLASYRREHPIECWFARRCSVLFQEKTV